MMGQLRRIAGRVLPESVCKWYWRRFDVPRLHSRFSGLSPRDTFSAIYREQLWNEGSALEFDSGPGSNDAFGLPYVQAVQRFLEQHGIRRVADLGCGDFRIGCRLATLVDRYDGVDCVPDLIAHLSANHSSPGVHFHCLDLTADTLPPAEAAFIRQVLQHLTNAEIQAVLDRCAHFRYLIVTEHVPAEPSPEPNVDHGHGPNTRLLVGSGVYLEHPPFSRRVTPLLELPDGEGAIFRTVVVENPGA